ncbi:hypothetical protein B0H14DRAFT_2636722 [Mycena olivaceomarginata]|nr:hypothetical protein B0H14DRAFT_2636722 [Mycena olivaceomarginata]
MAAESRCEGKTRGVVEKDWPLHDPEGFTWVQSSMVEFGHHVFSHAECEARVTLVQRARGAGGARASNIELIEHSSRDVRYGAGAQSTAAGSHAGSAAAAAAAGVSARQRQAAGVGAQAGDDGGVGPETNEGEGSGGGDENPEDTTSAQAGDDGGVGPEPNEGEGSGGGERKSGRAGGEVVEAAGCSKVDGGIDSRARRLRMRKDLWMGYLVLDVRMLFDSCSQLAGSKLATQERKMGENGKRESPLSINLQGLYTTIEVAETRAHASPELVETKYKRLLNKSPWPSASRSTVRPELAESFEMMSQPVEKETESGEDEYRSWNTREEEHVVRYGCREHVIVLGACVLCASRGIRLWDGTSGEKGGGERNIHDGRQTRRAGLVDLEGEEMGKKGRHQGAGQCEDARDVCVEMVELVGEGPAKGQVRLGPDAEAACEEWRRYCGGASGVADGSPADAREWSSAVEDVAETFREMLRPGVIAKFKKATERGGTDAAKGKKRKAAEGNDKNEGSRRSTRGNLDAD